MYFLPSPCCLAGDEGCSPQPHVFRSSAIGDCAPKATSLSYNTSITVKNGAQKQHSLSRMHARTTAIDKDEWRATCDIEGMARDETKLRSECAYSTSQEAEIIASNDTDTTADPQDRQ